MALFNIGDRVEITGDIVKYYGPTIGVIVGIERGVTSIVDKLRIRLADGTLGTFLPFQVQIPDAIAAYLVFDNSIEWQPTQLPGSSQGRQITFSAQQFEIHLKLLASDQANVILGQIFFEKSAWVKPALVTLLVDGNPEATTATNEMGEFRVEAIPAGEFELEVLLAGRRILAYLAAVGMGQGQRSGR